MNSVGNSYKFKIDKIVTFFKKGERADFQFITASENNAWLLNMRGKIKILPYSTLPRFN